MLVVTTRWAIGDGTVHTGPSIVSIGEFFRAARRAAWRAGFQRDGTYHPLDSVQLVFAGDTVDGLCTRAWHDSARPWRSGRRSTDAAERVAAGAARSGRRAWALVLRMMQDGITVPAADGHHRPVLSRFVSTRVDVCCLWGDFDRVLDRTMPAVAAAKAGVRVGTECGVVAEPRPADRPPTLRESVIVDLLVDFAATMLDLPAVRSIATPRLYRLATAPLVDMPRHIDAWATASGLEVIRDVWRAAVRRWHSRARIDAPEAPVSFAVAEPVAEWFERAAGQAAPPAPAELRCLGAEWSSRYGEPGESSLPLAIVADGEAGRSAGVIARSITAPLPGRAGIVARIGANDENLGIIDAA